MSKSIIIWFSFVVCIIAGIIANGEIAAKTKSFFADGFENTEINKAGSIWKIRPKSIQATLVNQGAKKGNKCLKLILPEGGSHGLNMLRPVGKLPIDVQNKILKLSGYVRFENVSSNGNLTFRVRRFSGDKASFSIITRVSSSQGVGKWIYFEKTGIVKPKDYIHLRVLSDKSFRGDIYFDDIKLSLVAPQKEKIPEKQISFWQAPNDIYKFTTDKATLFMTEKSPSLLKLYFFTTQKLKAPRKIVVEAPAGIRVDMFSYRSVGFPDKATSPDVRKYKKNGNIYQSLTWNFPRRLALKLKSGPDRDNAVYFFFTPDTASTDLNCKTVKIYLTDGKTKGKPAITKTVKMLPRPICDLPDWFNLYTYYATSLDFDNHNNLKNKLADLYESVGINGCVVPRGYRNDQNGEWAYFKQREWWTSQYFPYPANGFFKLDNSNKIVNYKGKIIGKNSGIFHGVSFCPQFLLKNASGMTGKLKTVMTSQSNGIYIDYEPYTLSSASACCFCHRCIKAFQKATGLPATSLQPHVIQKKYKKQWTGFRTKQTAQMIKALADAAKTACPEQKIVYCSLPQAEDLSFGAIDNRLYNSFVDIFMPMIYDKGIVRYDDIANTAVCIKKRFMPTIYSSASMCHEMWNSPEEIETIMLAVAANKGHGAVFFSQLDLDGKYIWHIAKAMNTIKKLENFYHKGDLVNNNLKIINRSTAKYMIADGEKVKLARSGIGNLRSTLHKYKQLFLYTGFNFDVKNAKQISISVNKPEAEKYYAVVYPDMLLVDADSNSPVIKREQLEKGIFVKILPKRNIHVAFYPFDQKAVSSLTRKISFSREKSLKSTVVEPPLSGHNIKITRTRSRGTSDYEMLIATTSQKVFIDPDKDGCIKQWIIRENVKSLVAQNADYQGRQGGLCRDWFNFPRVRDLNSSWQVVARKIFPNKATVKLRTCINHGPLSGFVINKTYSIYASKPQIDVSYLIEVKRSDKKDADFVFRIHNEADFGMKRNEQSKMGTVVPGYENKTEDQQEMTWGTPGKKYSGYFKKIMVGTFSQNHFAEQVGKHGPGIKVTFANKKQVDFIYTYRVSNPYTFEWFYNKTDFPKDPHKPKIWRTSYTLEYRNSKSINGHK